MFFYIDIIFGYSDYCYIISFYYLGVGIDGNSKFK